MLNRSSIERCIYYMPVTIMYLFLRYDILNLFAFKNVAFTFYY